MKYEWDEAKNAANIENTVSTSKKPMSCLRATGSYSLITGKNMGRIVLSQWDSLKTD